MSLEELILRHAAGLEIGSFDRSGEAVGVMMIPIPRAGILRGVDGIEAAKAIPGIVDVDITARLNYPIHTLPEGASYLGFIFGRGSTPEEVEKALRIAHGRLNFDIRGMFQMQMTPAPGS